MTHTSRMAAITTPSRFGYEIVDVFFGEVRARSDQTIAMVNDLLRDGEGNVFEFQGRENNALLLEPVEV